MTAQQSVDASAGGTFMEASHRAILGGARLVADSDAATAILREGNGSGRILAKLAASTGEADEFRIPTQYSTAVHVTITGTNAQLNLFHP